MRIPKKALVISGGGSRGAWACGVLRHLHHNTHKDGWYDCVVGTSAGALIAPCAALRDIETVTSFYLTAKKSDYLRHRALGSDFFSAVWAAITNKPSVYVASGLKRKVEEMLTANRWRRLTSGKCEAVVCSVGLASGDAYFVNSHECPDRGSFVNAIMASASIPVAMPPVGGLVDGGVRHILPTSYAPLLDYDELDCLVLSPKGANIDHQPTNIIDILDRTLGLLQSEVLVNDLEALRNRGGRVRVLQIPEFYCSALNWTQDDMSLMVNEGYRYAGVPENWEVL